MSRTLSFKIESCMPDLSTVSRIIVEICRCTPYRGEDMDNKGISGKISETPKYLLFIVLLWLLLHFFSLDWGLPAIAEYAPDCIPANTSYTASEMMRADTFKYPPLQYLLVGAMTKETSEKGIQGLEKQKLRTERITLFRWTCAVMALGIALMIFILGKYLLAMSPETSLFASCAFLLAPVAVFYSHTSNMDIPCTFWFILSVSAAIFAETKLKKMSHYIGMNLLCGMFIGFTFCTKDQMYALYVLPAFLLVYLRYRKSKNILRAMLPLFLWGVTFALTTAVIYLLIGGMPVAAAHFNWLMNEGRASFYMVPDTVAGRIKLFFMHIAEFRTMLDIPLILLAVALPVIAAKSRLLKNFCLKNKILLGFLLALFISAHLFANQPLRSIYPRYMIPLLPFACILIFMLFEKCAMKRNVGKILLAVMFGLQALIAGQMLYKMKNSPQVELKNLMTAEKLPEKLNICTTSAALSKGYRTDTKGKVHPVSRLRPWAFTEYDFTPYRIKDILPEDFFIYMMNPEIMVAKPAVVSGETMQKLISSGNYETAHCFSAGNSLIPTFYQYSPEDIFLLKRKSPLASPGNEFAKMTFDEQLMYLTYLATLKDEFTKEQIASIGKMLAKSSVPDRKNYHITQTALMIASDAYREAGRTEDAAKMSANANQSGTTIKEGHPGDMQEPQAQ